MVCVCVACVYLLCAYVWVSDCYDYNNIIVNDLWFICCNNHCVSVTDCELYAIKFCGYSYPLRIVMCCVLVLVCIIIIKYVIRMVTLPFLLLLGRVTIVSWNICCNAMLRWMLWIRWYDYLCIECVSDSHLVCQSFLSRTRALSVSLYICCCRSRCQ